MGRNTKTKTRKVNRDAGTGRFVTKQYTKRHPGTTVTEIVKNRGGSKKSK